MDSTPRERAVACELPDELPLSEAEFAILETYLGDIIAEMVNAAERAAA